MSSVKDYLFDPSALKETKEVKFPHLNAPIVIQSLTTEEFEECQRKATNKKTDKRTRTVTTEIDSNKFIDLLMVKSVIEPNLEDEELQEHFQTGGSPIKTLRALTFKAGYYNELAEKVQELSGFDVDELVDEVKN